MDSWTTVADLLWRNAIAVIPLAILVALLCRWLPSRPSTRHTMWLVVMIWFVVPVLLPGLQPPDWLASAASGSNRHATGATFVTTPLGGLNDESRTSDDSRRIAGPRPDLSPSAIGTGGRRWEKPHRLSPQQPIAALIDQNAGVAGAASRKSTGTIRGPAGADLAESYDDSLPDKIGADTEVAVGDGYGWNSSFSTQAGAACGPECDAHDEAAHDQPQSSRLALPSPVQFGGGRQDYGATTPSSTARDDRVSFIEARLGEWLVGLAAVRDTVGRLPSVPATFWLSGIGVLSLVFAARAVRFRRVLHRANAAPPDVIRLVLHVADHIGLRRAPETLMVDARISPMICCGRRTRLILPRDLWNQLDLDGRVAILSHELAHLRRKDHWVCWVELAIGSLFWWHPVMWWARRRLHEEAEFCCDAWVTWLMPHGRRAYAEALLRTKDYISEARSAGPALGVGVTTNRTQRFARRLKMVMTASDKPRLSVAGLVLVFALASAGWAATPARSCPDKKKSKPKAVKATTLVVPAADPQLAPQVLVVPRGTVIRTVPSVVAPGAAIIQDDNSFRQRSRARITAPTRIVGPAGSGVALAPSAVMRLGAPTAVAAPLVASGSSRHVGSVAVPLVVPNPLMAYRTGQDDDKELEKRLRRLERELKKIREQISEMGKGSRRGGGAGVFGGGGRGVFGRAAPRDTSPETAETRVWRGGRGIADSRDASPARGRARSGGGGGSNWFRPKAAASAEPPTPGDSIGRSFFRRGGADESDEMVIRTYNLPKGKLKALTELMIRQDVPILVSPKSKGIEVHGTEREQAIFKAFIDIIHPEGKSKKSRGRTSADFNDAIRTYSDAVAKQWNAGVAQADVAAEQAARLAEAYSKQIAEASTAQYAAAKEAAAAYAVQAAEVAELNRTRYAEWANLVDVARSQVAERTAYIAAIENEKRVLQSEAERIRERAEELAEQADELSDSEEGEKARKRAAEIQQEARTLSREAKKLEKKSRQLERQAEKLEREMVEFQAKAEAAKAAMKTSKKSKKSKSKDR